MFRPLEIFIGTRYVRAKRGNHFLSFISLISILGIAIAVTALIAVLSVMNGFETEFRTRILDLGAHAVIEEYDGRLTDWRSKQTVAESHPEVLAAAPFVDGQGMLAKGSKFSGVAVRGVSEEYESTVSALADKFTDGSLADLAAGRYNIALGSKLAEDLGVGVGDKVVLAIAKANVTPVGIFPRMKDFTVSGIFHMDMIEYDRNLSVIDMDVAARLFRLGDRVSGLRLKIEDMARAPEVVREAALEIGGGLYVRDWTREHQNFFRSIKLTKGIMFVMLSLIVGVAAFNIVSTLVMVVTDKHSDIAILRTLGATPKSVMGSFLVQGTLIGVIGTALGLVLGLLLATYAEPIVNWLEALLQTDLVSSEVYFLSSLPSEIRVADVTTICITAIALSILSTLYPSWRAARVQPAEALRYD